MAKHFSGHSAAPEGVERHFEMPAFFTSLRSELELIHARRTDKHKLGRVLHIGFLRLSGRFLGAKR
jgi:hypothetical protein